MSDPFSDFALNMQTQTNPSPSNSSRPFASLSEQNQNKLPRIQREQSSKKIHQRNMGKSGTKLPILKIEAQAQNRGKGQNSSRMTDRSEEQRIVVQDFMSEIEKKLKIVFEKNNDDGDILEGSDSEQEFEKKIIKEKKNLQKQRMRKQAEQEVNTSQQPSFHSDKQIVNQTQTNIQFAKGLGAARKPRNKIDSMYEKRIKDYKDESQGNKVLLRKKQSIIKQNDRKKITPKQENFIKTASISNKQTERGLNHQKSYKVIKPAAKQQDLFEGLHNILLNPNRKSQHDIVSEKTRRARQNLQQKLKKIEDKLNLQRKEDLQLLQKLKIGNKNQIQKTEEAISTVRLGGKDDHTSSWRKIQVRNSVLEAKKSTFDEEVQRVNRYFERNEKSIEKYLQNQRKLTNLTLRKNNESSNIRIQN